MITLYQFPHSHFSEKARWALGFKGLSFEIVNLPRGKHTKVATGFGLPDTTVPFIKDGKAFIQGSSAILDYLETHYPERPLMPKDTDTRRDIQEFETYLDTEVGHHGRRYIYSSLIEHPALIKELFMGNANPLKRHGPMPSLGYAASLLCFRGCFLPLSPTRRRGQLLSCATRLSR